MSPIFVKHDRVFESTERKVKARLFVLGGKQRSRFGINGKERQSAIRCLGKEETIAYWNKQKGKTKRDRADIL